MTRMDQNAGMIILKSSDDLIIWDWDSTVSFKGMNMGITGMIGESDTGTTTGRDLPRKKNIGQCCTIPFFRAMSGMFIATWIMSTLD